jgi:hypothetical protein
MLHHHRKIEANRKTPPTPHARRDSPSMANTLSPVKVWEVTTMLKHGQSNWSKIPKGHIGLQDYGGALEFRGIKLRPLESTEE